MENQTIQPTQTPLAPQTPNTSDSLIFTGSPWPARVGGVAIFLCVVGVHFLVQSVPLVIIGIVFVFMLVAILFASDTLVLASKSSQTLTVSKKRILASTNRTYPFSDIAFVCQKITTSTDASGKQTQSTGYYIGLNSRTTTISDISFRGRVLVPITIPTSSVTVVSPLFGETQEISRARTLADFIGVPFYLQGSEHDTLVNLAEDLPGLVKDIQNIPKAMEEAKASYERPAQGK